jgi:neutral amino acid transport system permease protein
MVVDVTELLQLGVNGAVLGSILALAAVGLTLVYGILDLANFAHGDLLTLGAYLGLAFVSLMSIPVTLQWALVVVAVIEGAILADQALRGPLNSLTDRVGPDPLLSDQEVRLGLYGGFVLLAGVAGLLVEPALSGDASVLISLALALVGLLVAALQTGAHEQLEPAQIGIAVLGVPVVAAVLPLAVAPATGWSIPWSSALAFGLIVPVIVLLRTEADLTGQAAARWGLAAAGLAAAFLLVTPLLLAIALSLVIVGTLTVVLDLLIWRPMRARDAGLLTLIIISIGLALAIRNGVIITWGTGVVDYPGAGGGPLQLLPDVLVTQNQLIVIGVTLATIALVHLLLRHTKMGKAMRALADDMDLARVTGIDADRIILYVWFISGALAALAGVLLGMLRPFTTSVGWFLLLPIFAAVILGGIGSPYGAMAGGFVIGISMETSLAFGVPSDYRLAVGFAIMILVLVFRPEGIFGGQATR